MDFVRGKRRRTKPTSEATSGEFRNAKRGRPMKHISELVSPRASVNAKQYDFHRQSQPPVSSSEPVLSPLESLPNELIQQIFFQYFETSLPRASIHLAQAISTESTYNALILFAYFDDNGQSPVETRCFLPAPYRRLELNDKLRLQRDILACRWCTLERIRACLPVLSRLTMRQAWYRERDQEEALMRRADANPEAVLTVVNDVLESLAPLPDIEDLDTMTKHFFAKTDLIRCADNFSKPPTGIRTFNQYLPRIITWYSLIGLPGDDDKIVFRKTTDRGTSVLAARVLPDWLVRGSPWTADKVELLQLLRQGFSFIEQDFVLEISASAVFEGMASAILEQHIPALLTLLDLHCEAFEKAPFGGDFSSLTPPTNHPLPERLFHLATKAGANSSTIMWHLIRAGADFIPIDDNSLTAWALRGQAEGDKVADWLVNYMFDPGDADRKRDRFISGRLPQRESSGEHPPAQYRFSQELDYLIGGYIYQPTNLYGEPCG